MTPCPLGCGWEVDDVEGHMTDHHPDAVVVLAGPRSFDEVMATLRAAVDG